MTNKQVIELLQKQDPSMRCCIGYVYDSMQTDTEDITGMAVVTDLDDSLNDEKVTVLAAPGFMSFKGQSNDF